MVICLETLLSTIDTTARRYFQSRMNKQDQIIKDLTDNATFILGESKIIQSPIIATVLSNELCTHLIRVESNKHPVLLKDYDEAHLRSSVLLHYIFSSTHSLKVKLDTTVFIWYYYHFINKKAATTIKDLTHQVCFELEEAIKIIIKKELTLYREYNTTEMIAALRLRLASERLSNMGGAATLSKGINFRR